MKVCKYCGVEKPESAFSKHPNCRGGLQTRCTACRVTINKARRRGIPPPPPAVNASPGFKICEKCGLKKSITEFTKHRKHGDGLRSHCKACRIIENKAYRKCRGVIQRNPPDTKICVTCKVEKPADAFGPDLSHKDGLRSSCKECRKVQTKAQPSYRRMARARGPRGFCLGAEYDPNPQAAMYTVYLSRRQAPRRGLAWELSLDDALQLVLGDCLYCGAPPKPRLNHTSGKTFLSNGIDRLDPAKGYIPGNCVSCCAGCNWLKGTKTFEQFRELISNLYSHICDASGGEGTQ